MVVLTTQGTEMEREQCMDLGAFAFFQKPVDMGVLRNTLRKAKEKGRRNISAEKEKPQ